MHDFNPSLEWRQAALQLEARLRDLLGQPPERLDGQTISMCYPKRSWVGAWRVSITFSDGNTRRIDVVATASYPRMPVRTALVDHPNALTWPHVEGDGILCLLPNMSEVDPDDPAAVAENLLIRSVRLIEELLQGDIVERDFKEEFLTYWAYKTHFDGSRLFSLIRAIPPSRTICVWKGEGVTVVGENEKALLTWVERRYGGVVTGSIAQGAFLWMETPPLPSQYPSTAADLNLLASELGPDSVKVLEEAARQIPEEIVTVVGAEGRGGAGLIAVRALNPKFARSRSSPVAEPVTKGFRAGNAPPILINQRFFGGTPVVRSSVQRADAAWIHGRGQDTRTERLLSSTVVVIGCGSVGAPVACLLAQAGVGHLVLVDLDELSWPNVGRHPLGATAIGQNKAIALAERLQVDYPHLLIESRSYGMSALLQLDTALLVEADLMISATGSWAAEHALNDWHIEQGRKKPVLYCWTEAHACAGHAVAIAEHGGCLQCHLSRTGTPDFKVVDWPDGQGQTREEPACGAHYQPYGPVELSFVTAMASEMALDCLLETPSTSTHRIFSASRKRIEMLGGTYSANWCSDFGTTNGDSRVVDRNWSETGCPACRQPPSDK
ncbi:ubiquitin-activating enzyme [Brucella pseudogrignonensis]|uniref:ThiF family adenylyltransferase n=1 Tax=Brucella pseudogrignonensis TaxID=419475 RepID=UPI0007DA623C|nr:ThiF family adenylyltransferase [Brucella pseudogrignonensis]ANG99101.1 ubiquitin-activating enzyme [Brucella pseudogrignonensis]